MTPNKHLDEATIQGILRAVEHGLRDKTARHEMVQVTQSQHRPYWPATAGGTETYSIQIEIHGTSALPATTPTSARQVVRGFDGSDPAFSEFGSDPSVGSHVCGVRRAVRNGRAAWWLFDGRRGLGRTEVGEAETEDEAVAYVLDGTIPKQPNR